MRRNTECTFFVETPAHDTANSTTNFPLECRSSRVFQVVISLQLLFSDSVVNIAPIWVTETLGLEKTLKRQNLKRNNNIIINLGSPFKITNNNLELIYSSKINLRLYPFLWKSTCWESDVKSRAASNFWVMDPWVVDNFINTWLDSHVKALYTVIAIRVAYGWQTFHQSNCRKVMFVRYFFPREDRIKTKHSMLLLLKH